MPKSESPTKKKRTELYIVHGWAYSIDSWQPTIDMLRKAKVDCKFLKVPGLTSPSRKVWSIEGYVDWLDKELKSVKQPIVLGHSNGGRILLNYCFKHPKKIKHLILLNSAGIPPTFWQNIRQDILKVLSKVLKPLKKVKGCKSLVHKVLRVRDYNQAPANMKLTLRNMLASDFDLIGRFNQITTPTSLIWGENDKMTSLKSSRFLNSTLGNVSSFEVLPQAKHAPYATHPHILTEAILKVLMNL